MKKEIVRPPLELLQPCNIPDFSGNNEDDLVQYALELRKELKICNLKLEKQREWYERIDSEETGE